MMTETLYTLSPEDDDLQWEISEVSEYFHVSCFDQRLDFRGSGFARNKETAKKKAFSEINERYLVHQLKAGNARRAWGLDFDGSCSGFAVGYSSEKATLRAAAEAIERWTLSKWIDDGISIPAVSVSETVLRKSLSEHFSSLSHYIKPVSLLIGDHLLNMTVSVTLGWWGSGVFAGYGTKLDPDEAIDHSHVEALRNLIIYRNQPERSSFPYDRIWFFAGNGQSARTVLDKTKNGTWLMPRIKLVKSEKFGDLWLSRVILEGWIPWQIGSRERFLY